MFLSGWYNGFIGWIAVDKFPGKGFVPYIGVYVRKNACSNNYRTSPCHTDKNFASRNRHKNQRCENDNQLNNLTNNGPPSNGSIPLLSDVSFESFV